MYGCYSEVFEYIPVPVGLACFQHSENMSLAMKTKHVAALLLLPPSNISMLRLHLKPILFSFSSSQRPDLKYKAFGDIAMTVDTGCFYKDNVTPLLKKNILHSFCLKEELMVSQTEQSVLASKFIKILFIISLVINLNCNIKVFCSHSNRFCNRSKHKLLPARL